MSEYMLFCLGDGKYKSKGEGFQKNNRIFNVDITNDEWKNARNSLPSFVLAITHWVNEKDMTKEDKSNYSHYKEIGGCLKRLSYEEAWEQVWGEFSKEDKQKFLNLPHFNKDIFKQITGIDVNISKETIKIGDLFYDKEEIEEKLRDIKPVK